MKQHLKRICPLICLFLFLCCSSVTAASIPGKVTGLKATAKETSIKLTWRKTAKASKYAIYRVDKNHSKAVLVKKTSSTTYRTKGVLGVTYYYKVCALNSANQSGAFSSVVSVKPTAARPAKPKNFTVKSRGNKSITFKWSKVSGKANGYVIERYNPTTKAYETVKTISSKSQREATVSRLTADTTYKFRIRSYRTVSNQKVYSNPSSTVSATAIALTDEVKSIRRPYYTTKLKKSVTVTSNGRKIKLKKGTRILATSKHGRYVNAYTSSGSRIKIRRSSLRYTGLDSTADYSKKTKEQFINLRGISSRTSRLIWVSQRTYRTNIFKGSTGKWKLVKSYKCIIGRWQNRTSGGIRRILRKVYYGSYGAPCLTFTRGQGTSSYPTGCAFHHYVDGNRTGAKSHGCVRMSRSALIYMYNTCPIGTTVFVY